MSEEKKIQIGGQAVLEGVMMRGPEQIATAVRRKDDSIDVQVKGFVTRTKTHPFYSMPIIRGFVSLIEMMNIGFKSLNYSATRLELDVDEVDTKPELYERSEPGKKPKKDSKLDVFFNSLGMFFTYAFAFLLAFALFGYVPYLLADFLNIRDHDILFNLFAGSIRIVFFVLYVYLISFMKDIRRVFEYHGAEHKVVHAHEKAEDLNVQNVKPHTTIHPRCGTSFIFLVLLISILVFTVLDTIVSIMWKTPGPLVRLCYHLPFVPVIAGISYEFLKHSEKHLNHFWVKIFTKPGMALQKVTTQEPDESQIETAIISLRAALKDDFREIENQWMIEDGEWQSDYCKIRKI